MALQIGGYRNPALAKLLWIIFAFAFVQWVIRHEVTKRNFGRARAFVQRTGRMHSFFVFLIIGSCVGAVGGILTWLIMLQSQNERQTSTTSTSKVPETESTKSIPTAAIPPSQATSEYPEVDFEFKPEKVRPGDILSRPPKLILIVRDRGPSQLKQLKLRATQYQFDFDAIIPTKVTKLPDDKIRIEPGKYELAFNKRIPPATGTEQPLARSIKGHGGEKRIDLSVIKSFRFITPPKPGEPGGAGGPPLSGLAGESDDLRFYAIRFTFLDTGVNRRFCYYKVISCKEPYLLPFDNPSVSVMVDPEGRQAFFRAPIEKILADQRDIYKYHPEEEYIPGGDKTSVK